MRSQVMSFLQGGFEIAAKPGDDLHETLLSFVAAGGRLKLETHICIIRDALISVSDQGDLQIK